MIQLEDLRKPAESLAGPTAEGAEGDLKGLIGTLLGAGGQQSAESKKKLEEASKTANDLTGLVKKKGKK